MFHFLYHCIALMLDFAWLVRFNVVERPWNKLVPVIFYISATLNSRFLTSLSFIRAKVILKKWSFRVKHTGGYKVLTLETHFINGE